MTEKDCEARWFDLFNDHYNRSGDRPDCTCGQHLVEVRHGGFIDAPEIEGVYHL